MGELVEAKSKCCMENIAPENAKSISVREALSWIIKKRARDVLVKIDCLVVVQVLRSSGVFPSYFGRFIEDWRTLLSELGGRNVIVKFIRQSANKVVHFLAKSTYSITNCS